MAAVNSTRNYWLRFLIVMLCFGVCSLASAADLSSPIGRWRTIDDKTGKPRGTVRVYEQDGLLFARIEESYSADDASRTCA